MITSNKKLIKNFREILAASINAKGLINAEIDKVDAKYKALADKEKAEFNKQLKALESQIEMCNCFLKGADCSAPEKEEAETVVEEVVEEPVKEEPEVVVDTIFEDNNSVDEDIEEMEDMPATEEIPVEEEISSEEPPAEGTVEDEFWGKMPEEWN